MEDKFKDVKVGDTVMVEETVKFGWNEGKQFFIPVEVIKVTKTQFVTMWNHRFKKSGFGVGADKFTKAYFANKEETDYQGKLIVDQNKERLAFITKLNTESKSMNLLKSVFDKLKHNSTVSTERLKELNISLELIKDELKEDVQL